MDLSGLSFLSEADLKSRLTSNELRLKNAQSKLKDQTALVDENKKRAQNFVDLFAQGIVSKKELEGSSKDAEQAVADLEEAKGKCKDLELTVKAMKDRLSVLQKRKALSKANSKLIGSFETRKQNKSKSRLPSKQKIESKSSLAETASDKSKK
jgi:multidrug resistance efflux pump